MRTLLLILSCSSACATSLIDVASAAHLVGVPAELLTAICKVESGLVAVRSLDGATHSFGICQVKLETAQHMDSIYKHKHLATAERLMDNYINAFYAAKYLAYQYRRYGDWMLATDAYNKGRAVSSSSAYVKKVWRVMQ